MSDTIPSLVIHIGGAKAGSTSIQECLKVNRQVLAEHGIAIPNTELKFDAGPANQIWYVESLSQREDPAEAFADDLDAFFASFSLRTGQTPKTIILSAENLSNHHPERLFAKIKGRFRIHIVLYIRRQEDAYQAAWQQWFVKSGVSIDEWLEETDGYFCDWHSVVSRWEALNPEKINVRIFDRELLVGGDAVDDFCALVFPPNVPLLSSRKDMNVSFGAHVAHLFASMPEMFSSIHDIQVDNVLYRHELTTVRKRSNEWIFTRAQLDSIRQRHAAGNAQLKQAYFQHVARPELFPPVPADAVTGLTQDEINRRNIAVVAELVLKHILRSESE